MGTKEKGNIVFSVRIPDGKGALQNNVRLYLHVRLSLAKLNKMPFLQDTFSAVNFHFSPQK